MKKTLWTLSLTLLTISLLVFIACTKDISSGSNASTDPNHIPAEATVTASLQGRVLDENGLPVQGAAVVSGKASTTTDVNGVFTLRSISMSSRFGFVKVTKPGYFTGSRSVITNPGASNYVNIQLQPRTLNTSFPAVAGGTVTVQTGVTAVFDAASIVVASTNAAYTGNVNVYATYLDPTDPNLNKHMPGDLRGIDTSGKETALQTFGMMAVELEDGSGQKLQIAPGKKATLSLAIPASLQATAPVSIPLWYFNDSTGKWMQQGTATRQGNSYVGQVGHFSYWNCDAPMGTVNFKVHLKDQHGNALAYTYLEFQSTTIGNRGGYTDSTGFAQGLIPRGVSLSLKVMTECGSLIGGASIGPALTDQDLGILTITEDNAELVLTGTVVDCASNPVDSGYVNALLDGLNYRAAVAKGVFTLPIHRCFISTVPVRLTAGDYSTLQQGNAITVQADTGTLNAGQLTACGTSLTQFINISLNGQTYSVTVGSDSIYYYSQGSPVDSYFGANSANGVSPHLRFDFDIPNLAGTGPYSATNFDIGVGSQTFWPMPGTSVQYSVTAFGPVNGYINGSMSGTLQDTVSKISYPMTGTFHVRRTN